MKRIIWILLALCALSVNVQAHRMGTPILPDVGGVLRVHEAGFPFIAIWEIVSSPGFINLALIAVAFIARGNAKAERWTKILEIGFGVVRQLKEAGNKDWIQLVNIALKYVVDEVSSRPDLKTLTPGEIEDLQAALVPFAKRTVGIVDKPMQ